MYLWGLMKTSAETKEIPGQTVGSPLGISARTVRNPSAPIRFSRPLDDYPGLLPPMPTGTSCFAPLMEVDVCSLPVVPLGAPAA